MAEKSILSLPVKVYALGGLGEVGKNTYCIESEEDLIVIDAGVKFPEDNLTGVDYVIPDYTQIKNNQNKLKGLIITHGHEDHIGAIPFLVQQVNVPVIYAPKLAAALIRNKLEEHRIKEKVNVVEYEEDDVLTLGKFKVSFFRVTHSIPDSFGICIDTEAGRIVTTGDFKVDLTPVGPDINLQRICQLGAEGVDLFLADSTNAAQEGYTPSEKNVVSSISEIFSRAESRIIVSTFSSNISRIQQITDCAKKYKRKVVVVGRSMENIIAFSKKYGYVSLKEEDFIQPKDIKDYEDNQIVILCTGAQGETMAALSRIANGEHKYLKIQPNDTVIFSSSPIPGNQINIDRVVNQLTKMGATVITNSIFSDIHSSGHPRKQELRLMLKLIKPKYFMPAHGEYYMLKSHGVVAQSVGIKEENIFICENGDTLILQNHKVKRGDKVIVGTVFVDGNDINGISQAIINDRTIMKENGIVEAHIAINTQNEELIGDPVIRIYGLIGDEDFKDHLVRHASEYLKQELTKLLTAKFVTFSAIKTATKNVLQDYIFRKTQRNPIIVPVVLSKNS